MMRRRALLTALVAFNTLVIAGGFSLLSSRSGSATAARGQTADRVVATASPDAALSAALSAAAYPDDSVSSAVLARNDIWVDALSSSTLQGELGAPLLLTSSDSLAPEVTLELERLGAKTVYLMGGPEAFDPKVAQALTEAGYAVERVPGQSAVGNAVAVAGQYLPRARTALLVRGADSSGVDQTRGYVDALVAVAWAAVAGMPVLLTDPFQLSPETRDYLAQSQVEKVIVAGGRVALGGSITLELERLGVEVDRIGGQDRFETAARIARLRDVDHKNPSVLLIDGSGERMGVAGFAAAVYSIRTAAPILLTNADALPEPTDQILKTTPNARLICGPGVTDTACAAAKNVRPADVDALASPS
ncbi:MAG: cell wall-binding repeat-containing protein [Egibacteraceae bacterium]